MAAKLNECAVSAFQVLEYISACNLIYLRILFGPGRGHKPSSLLSLCEIDTPEARFVIKYGSSPTLVGEEGSRIQGVKDSSIKAFDF